MKVKRKNLMKYKKILNRLMTVAMLLVIFMNFVSPMINESYGAVGDRYTYLSNNGDVSGENGTSPVIDSIMGFAMGAVGTALSAVVLGVVGILYMLIILVFSPIMGWHWLPGPEDIVYNGIPVFDPNFIAPSENVQNNSFYIAQNTNVKSMILQFYQTGYVVAGSIFVIGAMIIGIKLAVTSIASEKAYYKEMIGKWIKGLVLLFTIHIIITACFYLNEQIVNALYHSVYGGNVGTPGSDYALAFQIPYTPLGPVGKLLNGVLSFFTGDANTISDTYKGFGISGLIGGLMLRAMTDGDLIAAITVAALIGQILSLMITYFKRVFVCIILAAIAPYVVAVDFIRKLI